MSFPSSPIYDDKLNSSNNNSGKVIYHQRSSSLPVSPSTNNIYFNHNTNSSNNLQQLYDSSNNNNNNSNNSNLTKLRRSSSQLFQQNNCEPFIFAQSLTSVCLDPTAPQTNEWKPDELIVPPVSASIPNITAQHFQSYLNKISQVYRVFKENELKDLIPTNKKTSEEIISLDNIPEFFFRKELTKSQILEYANNDTSPIIFQKLEHYSTIIEENIVGNIREKSQSFVSAMSDLKQFRSELNQLYQELNDSRNMLKKIDTDVVKSSLNISRLHLQKNRTIDTLSTMQLVNEVKQAQPTLQLLLSKGDYGGALDLIESTQNSLENELVTIGALKNIGPQLSEMLKLIEKMLESDFIKIALNDDLINETFNSKSNNNSNNNIEQEEQFNDMLRPIIANLLRIGRVGEVLEAFRESADESVRNLFKTVVSTSTFELDENKVNNGQLQPMKFTWDECKLRLVKLSPIDSIPLFNSVNQEFMRKMITVKKIIDMIVDEVEKSCQQQQTSGKSSPINKGQSMIIANQIDTIKSICSNIVISVNETMQERVSSLIKVRSDVNAKLALPDFVSLTQKINEFIEFSENILLVSKKKASILRSTQLTQSKQYLETLHKNRLASLSLLLENEEWVPMQVVSEFQNIVDSLVDQSLNSASPLLTGQASELDQPLIAENPQQQAPSPADVGINEYISISGEKFKIGNTSLMLLKFIKDYLHCVEVLPSLVIDSIPKFVELLHTFNGITYQLVLGAGARQTMNIKTINSKHLGLTSQCLSFLIKLIPHIKTILQHSLITKSQYPLLNGFDKIVQDYTSHRGEIFLKFVAILKERSLIQLKALSTLDLKNDTMPIPSPPIAALQKDFATLHKLLNNLLPPDQIFKIFTNIYYMLNNLFIESIPKLDLGSKAARRRLHNDILHFMASLRKLSNTGDPGTAIEDFLQSHFPI